MQEKGEKWKHQAQGYNSDVIGFSDSARPLQTHHAKALILGLEELKLWITACDN